MSRMEKFKTLVSPERNDTVDRNRERVRDRDMLHESQRIALKVLERLDILGWSRKDLALALQVSPQQVSKIVSGKENLTIATLVRLQQVLEIPILASYVEDRSTRAKEPIALKTKRKAAVRSTSPRLPAGH